MFCLKCTRLFCHVHLINDYKFEYGDILDLPQSKNI